MKYELVRYDQVTEDAYEDYISEWEMRGEHVVPSASKRNEKGFVELISKWREDETDAAFKHGFVPSTLYFLIDQQRRIVGSIHLRQVLNQRLLENGGNIGYGVRASERGKGIASLMLNMLLENLQESRLERVLLTCDDDNIGSIKTIEGCGGILQDKVVFENVLTRRYWIELKREGRRTIASI